MSMLDTVTSTIGSFGDRGQAGGSSKENAMSGKNEVGGDQALPPAGDGSTEGGGNGSFDLTSLTKDIGLDAAVSYDQKDYSEKTTFDTESSQKDNGSETSKQSSEYESFESKDGRDSYEAGEAKSEYRYSDDDFGGSSRESESYSHEVAYTERSFDAEISLDKSFDTLSRSFDSFGSSQDSLIG